ncbi:unnamed protein product [Protopolystoma xenopodis]|uniref:Uncharacterized protein n=1 Tax=Protopolystoma xenopodis TaxID=117903 RepID=A0A448XJI1_9PLAT|nr:unnamed protein product [Protopolystoma xenopodis]
MQTAWSLLHPLEGSLTQVELVFPAETVTPEGIFRDCFVGVHKENLKPLLWDFQGYSLVRGEARLRRLCHCFLQTSSDGSAR